LDWTVQQFDIIHSLLQLRDDLTTQQDYYGVSNIYYAPRRRNAQCIEVIHDESSSIEHSRAAIYCREPSVIYSYKNARNVHPPPGHVLVAILTVFPLDHHRKQQTTGI
jgi:hypothetical protein